MSTARAFFLGIAHAIAILDQFFPLLLRELKEPYIPHERLLTIVNTPRAFLE
jgi:hypothetical protein